MSLEGAGRSRASNPWQRSGCGYLGFAGAKGGSPSQKGRGLSDLLFSIKLVTSERQVRW